MANPVDVVLSGADEVIPEGALAQRLSDGRPLRVKFGIDPSRPDLHLGHAVPLRMLRRFQDLGHTAVLIIGDFTGRVGDPSGRSETRPMLSREEIDDNAATYLEQAGLVLDLPATEILRNSDWLARMDLHDVLELAASTTVAQMLERDDFSLRFKGEHAISLVEFMYPLLQGHDSVEVRADVEIGGTDQKFNLLMGRTLQKQAGQTPQVVVTVPLLVGTDGSKKMSKSYDNSVGLTEPASEMFGKLMSLPDALIGSYLRMCTALSPEDVDLIEEGLADGALHPNDEKRHLARLVVDTYHGAGEGEVAEARFNEVFREHQIPEDIPQAEIPPELVDAGAVWLPKLMSALDMVASNGEARRLIAQGGVRIDGDPWASEEAPLERLRGAVLQVGRRKFMRLR